MTNLKDFAYEVNPETMQTRTNPNLTNAMVPKKNMSKKKCAKLTKRQKQKMFEEAISRGETHQKEETRMKIDEKKLFISDTIGRDKVKKNRKLTKKQKQKMFEEAISRDVHTEKNTNTYEETQKVFEEPVRQNMKVKKKRSKLSKKQKQQMFEEAIRRDTPVQKQKLSDSRLPLRKQKQWKKMFAEAISRN